MNTSIIIQLIAVLGFIIVFGYGLFLSYKRNEPTVFSYLKHITQVTKKEDYFGKLTKEEIKNITPKMMIGVSYDREGILPLKIYDFSIQNPNLISVPVTNLSMKIAFNGIVQEIIPSLNLSSVGNVSMNVISFEGKSKNGDKVLYRPDTSQLMEDRGISILVQKIDTEKGKLNTNVVNFYCKEWPADAFFWSFITVNPSSTNQRLLENITDGTYEGTYDYYIGEKKFTEKIKGVIK